MLAQHATAESPEHVQKGTYQAEMLDPFQQQACRPFSDSSSAPSSSGGATDPSSSPPSSVGSLHDERLISSCDPAASEFLLYALAFQEQNWSDPQQGSGQSNAADTGDAGAGAGAGLTAGQPTASLSAQPADSKEDCQAGSSCRQDLTSGTAASKKKNVGQQQGDSQHEEMQQQHDN